MQKSLTSLKVKKNCMIEKMHAFNIRDKGINKDTTPSFRGFNLND